MRTCARHGDKTLPVGEFLCLGQTLSGKVLSGALFYVWLDDGVYEQACLLDHSFAPEKIMAVYVNLPLA